MNNIMYKIEISYYYQTEMGKKVSDFMAGAALGIDSIWAQDGYVIKSKRKPIKKQLKVLEKGVINIAKKEGGDIKDFKVNIFKIIK